MEENQSVSSVAKFLNLETHFIAFGICDVSPITLLFKNSAYDFLCMEKA